MIPIHPFDSETACRPEWLRLNHLLSYCTTPLAPAGDPADDASSPADAPRCNGKDCLFSAKRR